ncbi:hypothetical protein BDL97_19G026000 [Sphagnum fallax]|nr:hypothetical protein BDL97_19G026000 [Sphagnum fallax]
MCVSVRSSPAQQLCFLVLQSWFPVGLPPPASLQLETHFGWIDLVWKAKIAERCQLCGMWLQAPARYHHCQSFPNQT